MNSGYPPDTFLGVLDRDRKSEYSDMLSASRHLPEGAVVAREGDLSQVVVILSGVLAAVCYLPSGQASVSFHGPGEAMGIDAAATGDPTPILFGLIAKSNAVVARLMPTDVWGRLGPLRTGLLHKAAMVQLARQYQRELIARSRSALPVRSRVMELLNDLARRFGTRREDGGFTIAFGLSQQEIADAIGASTRAVELAMRELRCQGLVETGYRKLTIRWNAQPGGLPEWGAVPA